MIDPDLETNGMSSSLSLSTRRQKVQRSSTPSSKFGVPPEDNDLTHVKTPFVASHSPSTGKVRISFASVGTFLRL